MIPNRGYLSLGGIVLLVVVALVNREGFTGHTLLARDSYAGSDGKSNEEVARIASQSQSSGSGWRTPDALNSSCAEISAPSFPMSESDLLRFRADKNRPCISAHAWNLLVQLTQSGESPDWETSKWSRKCGRLDLSPLCELQTRLSKEDPSTPGNSPEISISDGVFKLSSVFYNEDAADWISKKNLNQASTFQAAIRKGLDIPDFPKTSIVVKEIWEAVRTNRNNQSFIASFDPTHIDGIKQSSTQFKDVLHWESEILLDTDRRKPCVDKDYSIYSKTDKTPDKVPISCFYFQCIKKPTSAGVVVNGQRASPHYIVLVGVQIATREIEDWTWSTFWWTNKAFSVPEMTGRPDAKLKAKYHHFVMNTTLGESATDLAPAPPEPVFNPYLEGPLPGGTVSNCIYCHRLAIYRPKCNIGAKDCPVNRNGKSVLEDLRAGSPTMPVSLDPTYFNGALRTKFLWSLATNQDPTSNFPVLLLQKLHKNHNR